MTNEVVKNLMMAQNQMKIFHWQTLSYAQHKAFGKIYDNLSDLIDDFVEVCMGKHGRPQFNSEFNLTMYDSQSINVDEYITTVIEFLISLDDVYDSRIDSDLLNIRDEIMAQFSKLKYLLTLQ
jgi:hypothetical protein